MKLKNDYLNFIYLNHNCTKEICSILGSLLNNKIIKS